MTELRHITLDRPRWDQLYYERLADSLVDVVSSVVPQPSARAPRPRVLDIGCGRGELVERLIQRGYEAIGVDIELACAVEARRYAPIVIADFLSLNNVFVRSQFDVVISSHVLEHVENPSRGVQVMKLLSKRWIIIAVPNLLRLANWFLRRPRYVNIGHLHGWDSHHLKTFLEKSCGLKITRWVPDSVTIAPLRRTFLLDTAVLRLFEDKLLPLFAPQMANSLVALCEPADSPLSEPARD